jgi:membrane-bound lytic murein transglycosylase B
MNNNVKILGIAFITFAFAISSCSSVKLSQGFNYKPAVEGPAIGSQAILENQKINNSAENFETKIKSIETSQNSTENQINQNEEILKTVVESNQEVAVETQKPLEIRKTFQDVVNQYEVDNNKTFTKTQKKKLNKIAEILEHKTSFSSIYWAPETNVELFFLMGAGLGLLVGLLSIGLGWFIFIVFSLLYLYFKLIA